MERELHLKSYIDIIVYWGKNSIRYSERSLLAHDLLTIPIPNVALESTFNIGKKFINYMRSALKLKMVQSIACLDD